MFPRLARFRNRARTRHHSAGDHERRIRHRFRDRAAHYPGHRFTYSIGLEDVRRRVPSI